jgi:ParB-like chromosome segregation protein Spo0J
MLVKIDEIRDDFDLYYSRFKAAKRRVEELAEDISKNGLKNPIEIHRVKDYYEVVEGVHRLRACKMLGWKEVECIVRNYGPHATPFPRDRYKCE